MYPAIRIDSRSWLRSSSTDEPSDPPLRVIFSIFYVERYITLLFSFVTKSVGNKNKTRGDQNGSSNFTETRRRFEKYPDKWTKFCKRNGRFASTDSTFAQTLRAHEKPPEFRLKPPLWCPIWMFSNVDVNDPSAGSPTKTLLRLLLPLNGQVWTSSSYLPNSRGAK